MGGPGSGNYSVISKGWDIIERFQQFLASLERAQYDPAKSMPPDYVDKERQELRKLQDQFRSAIDRERHKVVDAGPG